MERMRSKKPSGRDRLGRSQNRLVRLGEGAQHAVGDGSRVGALLLETPGQPLVIVRRKLASSFSGDGLCEAASRVRRGVGDATACFRV